jgi:hypothetical protein
VIALMVESGWPGRRAAAIVSLSRSTAARSVVVTSVIVRDTSVAVSIARSAMPGFGGSNDGSMLIQFFLSKKFSGNRNEAVTFGYLRARVFAQRVRRPLAIRDSAVFNGGWRPRRSKCGSGKFVPGLTDFARTLSLFRANGQALGVNTGR